MVTFLYHDIKHSGPVDPKQQCTEGLRRTMRIVLGQTPRDLCGWVRIFCVFVLSFRDDSKELCIGDRCPQQKWTQDLYHVPSTVSFNGLCNFDFNLPSGPVKEPRMYALLPDK